MYPLKFLLILSVVSASSTHQLDAITDTLLREVMNRMQVSNFDEYPSNNAPLPEVDSPVRPFEARRDAILSREPSIRDKEYLEHSSLFGHKAIQGGTGEGIQRLKPDGSLKNVKIVKTDSLISYCLAPNPCPLGYVADDGCLEDFENTASFSREFEARQKDCICDQEHMFDCPGATRENEIDALARSFENEGLAESTLDRLFQDMEIQDDHKIVAKKFFSHKPENPFLEGDKLPVVAKKTPISAIK